METSVVPVPDARIDQNPEAIFKMSLQTQEQGLKQQRNCRAPVE